MLFGMVLHASTIGGSPVILLHVVVPNLLAELLVGGVMLWFAVCWYGLPAWLRRRPAPDDQACRQGEFGGTAGEVAGCPPWASASQWRRCLFSPGRPAWRTPGRTPAPRSLTASSGDTRRTGTSRSPRSPSRTGGPPVFGLRGVGCGPEDPDICQGPFLSAGF
ncbi:hypothetical protein [Streptomyces sp. WAC 01325]|uniref:hypothetical protein n=1 Tax=Streptomyces sp. WAC 01325 TaxID=2203202 RepID=UPI0028A94D9E|nr:hypothetical protein [Streptomyces sp. WAC 01325]